MSISYAVSLPASILLFGEYAITKPPAFGIAIACKPLSHGRIQSYPHNNNKNSAMLPLLTIKTIHAYTEHHIFPLPHTQSESLIHQLYTYCYTHIGPLPHALHMHIDTSALFTCDNTQTIRKKGLGSSATCTLLFCMLYSHACNFTDDICLFAITAYRTLCAKHASGYDILTSYYGGLGIIYAGQKPRFQHIPLPHSWNLYRIQQQTPVSTPHSIKAYQLWCTTHTQRAHKWHMRYRNTIKKLLRAQPQHYQHYCIKLAGLGYALGQALSISACVTPHIRTAIWTHNGLIKASGAGNEIAIAGIPAPQTTHAIKNNTRHNTTHIHDVINDFIPIHICYPYSSHIHHNYAYGIAYGKLLLIGEYSALNGVPVLGIPLPTYPLIIHISPSTHTTHHSTTPILLQLFYLLLEQIPLSCPTIYQLSLYSAIPQSVGFGSSAALTLALCHAYALLLRNTKHACAHNFSPYQQAKKLEHICFHFQSSGVDIALANIKKKHLYYLSRNHDQTWTPYSLTSTAYIIYGAIKRTHTARNSIHTSTTTYTKHITKLSAISKKINKNKHLSAENLAKLCTEAHIILQTMNIVHPHIDAIITIAKQNGALGGKMSGAGNGGAFIIISNTHTNSIITALTTYCTMHAIQLITPIQILEIN